MPIPLPNHAKGEGSMNQHLSVLVVDDSKFVRSRIVSKYRELGFGKIEEAQDGLEALSMLDRGEPYSVINLDVIMPHMHGLECLGKIRDRFPTVPILVLSSLAAEPSAAERIVEQLDENALLSSKYQFEEHLESDLQKLLHGKVEFQTDIQPQTPVPDVGDDMPTVPVLERSLEDELNDIDEVS